MSAVSSFSLELLEEPSGSFSPSSPFVVAFPSAEDDVFNEGALSSADFTEAAALLALLLYSLRLIFFLIGLGLAVTPFTAADEKEIGRLAENVDCTTAPLADIGVVAETAGVGLVNIGTGGGT